MRRTGPVGSSISRAYQGLVRLSRLNSFSSIAWIRRAEQSLPRLNKAQQGIAGLNKACQGSARLRRAQQSVPRRSKA
eukprot:3195148-Pyramimonas_sp.AAC.1